MKLEGIKNIIFDLGGVIIGLDQQITIRAFQELFQENFDTMEKELHNTGILEKFEIGTISETAFISFFKKYRAHLTTKEITEAWNAMLLDIPIEKIFKIKKLAKKYRVFLLSNTNAIHMDFINHYVLENFNLSSMEAIFEKAYYSYKLHLRKPNPEIFSAILKDKNLKAEETLFIDDSEEHIISAKQLNLNTYYLKQPETILDIF